MNRRNLLTRALVASSVIVPGSAILSTLSCGGSAPIEEPTATGWVFVGPYTRGSSEGIYRLRFDATSGKLGEPELAVATPGPSFLALHPNGQFLYAVNELSEFQGEKGGAVSAFTIDPATGGLTEINVVSSKGGGPCHLMLTPSGDRLVVANYGGGSTVSYRIGADGALSEAVSVIQHTGSGPNERRQQAPHAHGVAIRPVGSALIAHVADLGIDQVLHFEIAADGTLVPWETQKHAAVAAGAGPRHVVTHPDRPLAFVINELDSTLSSFTIDPSSGAWTLAHTVPTLPEGFEGDSSTAEVALHPNGRIVYGSNRGHDSIATFAIDLETGKLSLTGHTSTEGKTPRNFAVHPDGNYLIAANQGTGNLTVDRVDPATGVPAYTGQSVALDTPVCVVFL